MDMKCTREAYETLQYAQILTFADKKKKISSLTLFWAVYMMMEQYSFAPLFWSLLGVKDVEQLKRYRDVHYGSVEIEELPVEYSLVTNLADGIGE